jgi:hypothetical protein
MTITIEIEGETSSDLALAAEMASCVIGTGCTSGGADSEDGGYRFYVSRVLPHRRGCDRRKGLVGRSDLADAVSDGGE